MLEQGSTLDTGDTTLDRVEHRVLELAQEDILPDLPEVLLVLIRTTQYTTVDDQLLGDVLQITNKSVLKLWATRFAT